MLVSCPAFWHATFFTLPMYPCLLAACSPGLWFKAWVHPTPVRWGCAWGPYLLPGLGRLLPGLVMWLACLPDMQHCPSIFVLIITDVLARIILSELYQALWHAGPQSSKLSGGAIAGIVVGIIAAVLLAAIAITVLLRRRGPRHGGGGSGSSGPGTRCAY